MRRKVLTMKDHEFDLKEHLYLKENDYEYARKWEIRKSREMEKVYRVTIIGRQAEKEWRSENPKLAQKEDAEKVLIVILSIIILVFCAIYFASNG